MLLSDHGQTPSIPFRILYGNTLEETLGEMMSDRDGPGTVVRRAWSPDTSYTLSLLAGMAGARGIETLVLSPRALAEGATLVLLFALVWGAPNTRAIMEDERRWSWRPTLPWAVASGIATTIGLLSAGGSAEFLYARF